MLFARFSDCSLDINSAFFLSQLSAVVDGVYSEHSHTAGTFNMLSSSRVYVGGSQNTHALPGSRIHSNFVGCLRKVNVLSMNLNFVTCSQYFRNNITEMDAKKGDLFCTEANKKLYNLSGRDVINERIILKQNSFYMLVAFLCEYVNEFSVPINGRNNFH